VTEAKKDRKKVPPVTDDGEYVPGEVRLPDKDMMPDEKARQDDTVDQGENDQLR